MKIFERSYDPAFPERRYYIVSDDIYGVEQRFCLGWGNYQCKRATDPTSFKSIELYDLKGLKEIPLKKMELIYQEEMVKAWSERLCWTENDWENTIWGSEEEYNRIKSYFDVGFLEKKIEISLKNSTYFYENLFKNWDKIVNETYLVCYESYADIYYGIKITLLDDTWYEVSYGRNHEIGRWASLKVVSEEWAQNKIYEAKLQQIEEKSGQKAHARKCGDLSKKYGIRFEIVLKCFKGNEGELKMFVDSLKDAFSKEYHGYELCCGRNRRRNEIKRLGIDIADVDPNHIAPYIFECLRAGKIIEK